MRKNIKTALLIVIAAMVGFMTIRAAITLFPSMPAQSNTAEGLAYIKAEEKADISANENAINQARDEVKRVQQSKHAAEEISNGNFRAGFNEILICGDSLVKSIVEYEVLDSDQVVAEIGAGTQYLSDNISALKAVNPKYLVLHFGENELDKKKYASYFIARYRAALQKLKKELPNTRIYVDSIFPVLKKAYKSEPYTEHIDHYNTLLKELAKELEVTYLDYSALKGFFLKKYYDADGIHFVETFYTEKYLPYIFTEVYSYIDQ